MTGAEAAVVIGLIGTAATVYSTVQQGNVVKKEAKRQETAAEMDAMNREIQRTKRLNAYIASTNAQAGAGGIDPTKGSIANTQKVARRENTLGLATDKAATSAAVQSYRDKGKYASRASLVGAVAQTAGGISSALEVGRIPPAPGGQV